MMLCSLQKKGVADKVQGAGLPPLSDLIEIIQVLEIPISLCKLCADARGLREDDLIEGARFSGMYEFAKKAAESSVVSF